MDSNCTLHLSNQAVMTKYAITMSVLIHLIIACSGQNSGSPTANEPIKVRRIDSPVKLDGMSNETAWKGITSLPLLMKAPNYGSEPSERTEILIGYDDDYIYAAPGSPACRSDSRRNFNEPNPLPFYAVALIAGYTCGSTFQISTMTGYTVIQRLI